MLLSIVVAACGGGSGAAAPTPTPVPGKISGTVQVAGATIYLADAQGMGRASAQSGASGSYVLEPDADIKGTLIVTPDLTGYSFSPTSITINFTGADYPRVDFTATQDFTRGVTFSATLYGFDSVVNSHYDFARGVFVEGAQTLTAGSSYVWVSPTLGSRSSTARMSYNSTRDSVYVVFNDIYGTGSCGVSAGYTLGMFTYPLCSSVGITLDRAAGVITFASTKTLPDPFGILPAEPFVSSGITATGSLTFAPF